MLRLVADTNTVVSALLWRGAPHRLFQAIETEELSLYASRALIDELADVLARRKLAAAVRASGKTVSALVAAYQALVELVRPRAPTASSQATRICSSSRPIGESAS